MALNLLVIKGECYNCCNEITLDRLGFCAGNIVKAL